MNGNNEKKKGANSGLFETIKDDSRKDIIEMLHFTYEAQMFRMDEYIKKLFILCLVLIILLFGTNIAWFVHKSSAKFVDSGCESDLDNTGKMIALKPIYYTTDYADETEIVFQSDGVGDSVVERGKRNLYRLRVYALAC